MKPITVATRDGTEVVAGNLSPRPLGLLTRNRSDSFSEQLALN